MARPRRDHVAGDVEAAREDLSLIEAVEDGDEREILNALKLRIARAIQDPQTPARDLAALSRRLMEISKDLRALDLAESEAEGDAVSEDEEFDPQTV